jgi:hypothetical protein
MKLVLLDIDGVLATGPDGGDCLDGQEIHRASPGPLIPPPPDDTRVVLLTHRQRTEATQVVTALGLGAQVHGMVCADDLMAQWFRSLLRGRFRPGLTKELCAPILRRRFAWAGAETTAFIDNSAFNLQRIHAAGLAHHCIQVRAPHVEGSLVRTSAVGEALRTAYRLLANGAGRSEPIVRLDWDEKPTALTELATGVVLHVHATPAARLRASLAAIRRWAGRASLPRRQPPAQGL